MNKIVALAVLSVLVAVPGVASAHCDTLDGPVVAVAATALDTGNLAPVLAWVKADDEAEIRAAFAKTLAVRKLNAEAKQLADRYFFETLVRVHRAGEGAPYTGLKPAGSSHDPAVAAADKAVETGKLDPVVKLLDERVRSGLSERFARLRALKAPGDDVARGRAWVEAYVTYVHYVAGVHGAASGASAKVGEAHAAPHAD